MQTPGMSRSGQRAADNAPSSVKGAVAGGKWPWAGLLWSALETKGCQSSEVCGQTMSTLVPANSVLWIRHPVLTMMLSVTWAPESLLASRFRSWAWRELSSYSLAAWLLFGMHTWAIYILTSKQNYIQACTNMNTDIQTHTVMFKHTYVGTHKYRQAYSNTLTHSKHTPSPDSCPSYVCATSLAQLFYLVKGDSAWLHCCPRLKSVFMSCLVASSGHQEPYEWELKGKRAYLEGVAVLQTSRKTGVLTAKDMSPL